MAKIAVIILADIDSVESMGRVSNAFLLAGEAVENGDDLKLIFEGTGTRWISELEKEDHKLHRLYSGLKDRITGVCSFCSQAFGVKNQIEKAGLPLLSEYKDHPSIRSLFTEGFQVITF